MSEYDDWKQENASISGSVRVEPQLRIGVLIVHIKYIRECKSEPQPSISGVLRAEPQQPLVILAIIQSQDPVYRGFKNKNPANNQTSTETSNLNLDKQIYQ